MTIPIYIGYDPREIEAFCVLMYSILKHATVPISFHPLKKELFNDFYYRERHPLQSTEFSFTRFLVPYLNKYEGWAIYMDCDMLCKQDICNLWDLRSDDYSVMVVPHVYSPKEDVKFLNQKQTRYYRKNWSSMILFNCAKCNVLTPELVEQADGLYLHQFKWLKNSEIGFVSDNWNHLVGPELYEGGESLGLIHYTSGGPWFNDYKDVNYSIDWLDIRDELRGTLL